MYNKVILQLLSEISKDSVLAQNAFDLYEIADPSSFGRSSHPGESIFGPLWNIVLYEKVPHKWRVLADLQMRDLVVGEISQKKVILDNNDGKKEGSVNMIYCYKSLVENQLVYRKDDAQSMQLLVDQVKFMMGIDEFKYYPETLFSFNKVCKVYALLDGDALQPVRHAICRQSLIYDKAEYRFAVSDSESLVFAKTIIEEFAKSDPELAQKALQLIEKGEAKMKEDAIYQSKEKEKVDSVISAMC